MSGNTKDDKLWWFVDGVVSSEPKGNEPFVMEMKEGAHTVLAINAAGDASTLVVKVVRGAQF